MLVERCLWRFHCSIVKGMGVLELFQLDGGTAPCTTAIDTFHVPLSFGGVGEGGGGGWGECVCVWGGTSLGEWEHNSKLFLLDN